KAVKARADARRHRVIHRRMTEGALDAYGAQVTVVVEDAGHSDDRVVLEQLQRDVGIVEVYLLLLDLLQELPWEGVSVDLQPEGQRLPRRQGLDRLMQL